MIYTTVNYIFIPHKLIPQQVGTPPPPTSIVPVFMRAVKKYQIRSS